MSIRKPLGLGLVIGLLAMAFAALPAIASAAPQLTDAKGSVPIGTTINATSTNAKTVTESGTLECKHVEVHGIVKANSGTLVEVEMDGEHDTAKECTFGALGTVAVSPTLTSITLTPTNKQAVFDFTVLGNLESSTSAVSYTSPATSIHVSGPVTGNIPGTFSGDFTVSGPNGAITVD